MRVDHVEIVRPGLGPVFPRMGAGVGADEALLPVGGRGALVVRLERLGVVGALVAEDAPELLERRRARDQPIPVVVAALVAHVPEQRPIRLVERRPPLLALGIVGFGDVDGDDAVGVAGQHRRPAVRRSRRGTRRPARRRDLRPGCGPAGRARASVKTQPALGDLEAIPRELDARLGEIGDHARQPARDAQRIRIVLEDGPVADRLHPRSCGTDDSRPPTPAAAASATAARPPVRIERADQRQVRQIGDQVIAAQADGVLEEKQLAAMVAMEDLHTMVSPEKP